LKTILTGRHLNLSERLTNHTEEKTTKLEKYFQKLRKAQVIFSKEKNDYEAELIIQGDGVQFYGKEKAADFFPAIDLVVSKVENQIIRYKEKKSSHKVVPPKELIKEEVPSSEFVNLKLKPVSDKPTDKIEAYLEMKINEQNFILFKQGTENNTNSVNKNYAIIFKKNDAYRMIEIVFEDLKKDKLAEEIFVEYELEILNDSITKPEIKFNKKSDYYLHFLSLEDAFLEIQRGNLTFLPFFNSETESLNIIYLNGKEYEVMVPAI